MDIVLRAARYLRIHRSTTPRLAPTDVGRIAFRVQLSDLDELRHMNNGVYLSTMDLARVDLIQRAGVWSRMRAHGMYAVVASQTISYRKSLTLWQRYEIETRVVGYDERAVYMEQRFVVGGEVYARGVVAGRFLRRTGGVVSMAELGEVIGVDVAAHPVPAWLQDWARSVALPSSRKPAPSDWT